MQERSSIPKCKENPLHSASSDCSWKIAARKKRPQSSRYCRPLFLPCGTKTPHPLHRKTEPAPLAIKGSRLCVLRLAHLLMTIFSFTTSILISFLHLGQNREILSEQYPHTPLFVFCRRIWGSESTGILLDCSFYSSNTVQLCVRRLAFQFYSVRPNRVDILCFLTLHTRS